MSKEKNKPETFTATESQKALIAKFTKEEKTAFDKMDAEEKGNLMDQLETIQMSSDVKPEGFTSFGWQDEESDYPILSVQNEKNPLGIKAGQKIVGHFEGTVPMFSKNPKENWEELNYQGQLYYESKHYRFRRTDGKKFGLFGMSTLRALEKLPTKSSCSQVASDPMVEITYHGLIEGKEILKAKYGIELTKGSAAHVFDIKVKDTDIETVKKLRFKRGCFNYLKSPIPQESEKNVDPREVALRNWEFLQTKNNDGSALMIENAERPQITQ